MMIKKLIVLTMITTLSCNLFAADFNWRQWHGPDANGISKEKDWNPALLNNAKPTWQVSLGKGYASVAIDGDKLYATGNSGGKDTVVCLNAKTGKQIWNYGYKCSSGGGYAGPRATPVVYDKYVVIHSLEGHVICLDKSSGKLIWGQKLSRDIRNTKWKFSGSPLIYKGVVFINAGANGIAFNLKSGKIRWKSSGTGGYATPKLVKYSTGTALALFSENSMTLVNPHNGNKLASYPWKVKYDVNAATPIYHNSELFFSSGYSKGCVKLSIKSKPRKLWGNSNMQNHFASSILYKDHIYGSSGNCGRTGNFTCLDWKTGKVKWTEKMPYTSIMIADDKIIGFTEKGVLFIAEASANGFKELAKTKIRRRGVCWTAPVLCNGHIYCRDSGGNLFCFKVK